MKKISLIIASLVLASPAFAGTATVTYSATIVADNTVTINTQPNFGAFYITGSATTGTATLSNTGNTITTTTNSALSKVSSTGAASGSVTITGTSGYSVAITPPASVTISSGANNFTVTPTIASATCIIGTSCSAIGIGGSFAYGASATINAGSYTGSGTLTATYQ